MQILKQLYDCADTHLVRTRRDWSSFAASFKAIFNSEMTIYRVTVDAEGVANYSLEAICTTQPAFMKEYSAREIYKQHTMPESSLAPLEPARRTDAVSDEDYEQMGGFSEFLIKNGMYYLMVVPAVMPDGSFVSLAVWRDKQKGDFLDAEKVRLALFMRHLLAIASPGGASSASAEDDVVIFGNRFNLTDAEVGVLAALLDGDSPKTIASKTGRSYGTVRWHIRNILEKCQLGSQRNLMHEFYSLIKR